MKILIVDDYVEIKCWGIIKECKERGIEVEVAKSRNSALHRIICGQKDIDGIVLDMGLPVLEGEFPEEREGDDVLMELHRTECNIPVLIFSTTESEFKEECNFVVDQMTKWNAVEEEEKFFDFLEKIGKMEKE